MEIQIRNLIILLNTVVLGLFLRQHTTACIWKEFKGKTKKAGDYFFNLNGAPIGSYEEASALFSATLIPEYNSQSKGENDSSTDLGRSEGRVVNLNKMGSNVSRHSGKGLSGRRAQSSGSLYRMLVPRMGRMLNPCGNGHVRQRDRNKFCGSLPNHLDEKQLSSEKSSPGSLYHPEFHLEEIYQQTKAKNVELLFRVPQDLAGGDQGYGSEWSPEDEPLHSVVSEPKFFIRRSSEVAFISKENIFEARLEKGSRGLGLSVTGGIDTTDLHPGLIRIKRIFPHQPAWESGVLELNDIILEANGTPLTGLTNHEALEVLRTTTSNVILKICRPPGDIFYVPSSVEKEPPPPPPIRDPNHVVLSSQNNHSPSKLPLPSSEPYGEISVILHKVNGSLGFTLKKEDESVLGHYVRALVREPAISDGRIRPGDKIVSVNETDISVMSHEEAVMFLRQCGDEVRLRLYRDPAQTPVLALSPTESHKKIRPRPVLRKEAMDMLSDLAVKKFYPDDSGSSNSKNRLKSSSPSSSPRRRKLTKIPVNNAETKPEIFNYSVLSDKMENDSKNLKEETNILEKSVECLTENSESASMPPIPTFNSDFSYKNPIYQSAHTTVQTDGKKVPEKALERKQYDSEILQEKEGSQGLLKWKGIVFTDKGESPEEKGKHKVEHETGQEVTVELSRGWNSRLGFSLKSVDSKTLISAIYPDSVAAKDGRLRTGDEVVKINDESTKEMTTADVIDLLRKIRGTIEITVVRNSLSNKS